MTKQAVDYPMTFDWMSRKEEKVFTLTVISKMLSDILVRPISERLPAFFRLSVVRFEFKQFFATKMGRDGGQRRRPERV